jgi:hypothetical protein
MLQEEKTLSVPEAGRRYYGLSRNGSYDAAERGDLPTIRVGRLLRVPVQAMEQKLNAAAKRGAKRASKSRRKAREEAAKQEQAEAEPQ